MGSSAERQLVVRAAQRDAAAFEELVRLYSPRLYQLLVRVLGNAAEAEEVATETFVYGWRALPGLRAEEQFSTWLYRIAMNEAKPRLADQARRLALPIGDTELEAPDLGRDRAVQAKPAEFEAHVERCLAKLPAGYRTAVVLRDVEGLTNEEAAEVLGLELGDFKSLLHEGRMAISGWLEELYEIDGEPMSRLTLVGERR